MPSSNPVRRFEDIVENCDRIASHMEGHDLARFRADPRTVDAVGRCLQRITEAAMETLPRLRDDCLAVIARLEARRP